MLKHFILSFPYFKSMFFCSQFQISFVHETYANLTLVQTLTKSVLENFIFHKEHVDLSLQPIMCMLYQVNSKLQCKKIKRNRTWTNFERSGACKINKRMWNLKQDVANLKELEALKHARSAAAILVETLEYWENCVVEKKKGRLVVAKECQTAKRYSRKIQISKKFRTGKNRKQRNGGKSKRGRKIRRKE